MHRELEDLNRYLRPTFGATYRIEVGSHYGTVIVGGIGIGYDRPLTAIGDIVNIAARLGAPTRPLRAKILVSDQIWCRLGSELSLAAEPRTVRIRSRSGTLAVVALDSDAAT